MIYDWFIRFCKFKPTRYGLLCLKDHLLPCLTKSNSAYYRGHLFHNLSMLFEWSEKAFVNENPPITCIGYESIDALPKLIHQTANDPVCIIVTDNYLANCPLGVKLTKLLETNKIKTVIYSKITPNPLYESVDEIVQLYHDTKANLLISFGGGSAHDATKAAAICIHNTLPLPLYQGLNVPEHVNAKFICINTTSGTGAEASTASVITDHGSKFKMVVVDKYMTPEVVINDPAMTLDLPATATAWTGVDVLVHGIETYLSNISSNQAKMYALEAIKIVFKYLPIAYHLPHHQKAREQMMYAEYIAGMGFNITSLGFIHSMSHALSGEFNTPHGLANGMLLPHVLTYELRYKKVVKKLAEIARSIGINWFDEDIEYAQGLIEKIKLLLSAVRIPSHLEVKDHRITNQDIKVLATKAMKDFCGISNPVQFSKCQVRKIYKEAICGNKKCKKNQNCQ